MKLMSHIMPAVFKPSTSFYAWVLMRIAHFSQLASHCAQPGY
jgi:hypothetical protein